MATDKKKVMIFKGGKHSGRVIEWKGDGGPPPVAHALMENGSLAVYERKEIIPDKDSIDYIYMHTRTQDGSIDVKTTR